MSALVEYGVAEDPEGWRPRVWVDGAEEPDYGRREATPEAAVDVASEYAIHLAEKYLGQGGVEIRLRVGPATPPALGMESTLAELSALVASLGAVDVSAAWLVGRERWCVVWNTIDGGPEDERMGTGVTLAEALIVALVRAGGGL